MSTIIILIAFYDLTLKFPDNLVSVGGSVKGIAPTTSIAGLWVTQLYLLYRYRSNTKIAWAFHSESIKNLADAAVMLEDHESQFFRLQMTNDNLQNLMNDWESQMSETVDPLLRFKAEIKNKEFSHAAFMELVADPSTAGNVIIPDVIDSMQQQIDGDFKPLATHIVSVIARHEQVVRRLREFLERSDNFLGSMNVKDFRHFKNTANRTLEAHKQQGNDQIRDAHYAMLAVMGISIGVSVGWLANLPMW